MKAHTSGFTLIELLIVIAILGVLIVVLLPNLRAARDRANDGATTAYLRNCILAIESIRDPISGKIDVSPTSCEDPVLSDAQLTKPPAVASSSIAIDANRNSYVTTAVSSTGKEFKHDGYALISTTN
ncbi:prepilin-type N-terminal cleavage/methylation domain-containing protein [Deinococcus marmoris]|uniref:prepilin-type N-terminal cleavage/methylation domain-containing protein n=1 Tax=Deinococcus marmoris TaxID=249408 RepID=UPI0009DEE25C|nr:prepilin-type N-terminal cleavage/methylation domain-containing protein [Deinococcus marmoris]